jgi:serine/tyrosine/threonine adenylyltransferase
VGSGLYRYWNCGQLAVALRLLVDAPPLVAALERFGPLYQAALARRFTWRLGLVSRGMEADTALIGAAERVMRETGTGPDRFFFARRGGRAASGDEFGELARQYEPQGEDHPLWTEEEPPSLVIDEVEGLWAAIDRDDDWAPLTEKIAAIRRLGDALGEAPDPAGLTD